MPGKFNLLLFLFLLACTREKIEPLSLDLQLAHPSSVSVFENGTEHTLIYKYDASGCLIRKQQDTDITEYMYSYLNQRLQKKDPEFGIFRYVQGCLSSYEKVSYEYTSAQRCIHMIDRGSEIADTTWVHESSDSIRMLRNAPFSVIKYRAEHLLQIQKANQLYKIIASDLFYYNSLLQKYVHHNSFHPYDVCTIEYHNLEHSINREVLEDIFILRDIIPAGTNHLSIHRNQLFYLEEKLPLLLPKKIVTKHARWEFEYQMDKTLLSEAKVICTDGSGVNERVLKFNYSR